MTNQPTPQPSGRTAQEILDYADPNHPARFWRKQAAQRQLFDAMLEIVGEDELPNCVDIDCEEHPSYEVKYANQLRAELRQKLRIFFNQPEGSGKDGGK